MTRGPVPKRESQRRRRNATEPVDTAPAGTSTTKYPPPDDLWHPAAQRWYHSLAESGQSHWYQPSDWWQAWALADVLSKALFSPRVNASAIETWLKGAAELLTTEGARRRARIELERGPASEGEEVAAGVSDIDEYRRRAGSH